MPVVVIFTHHKYCSNTEDIKQYTTQTTKTSTYEPPMMVRDRRTERKTKKNTIRIIYTR